MKKRIRNWLMGKLWEMGLVDLPFWDDVRVAAEEQREAVTVPVEEERVPVLSGEALRAVLKTAEGRAV